MVSDMSMTVFLPYHGASDMSVTVFLPRHGASDGN